MNEIRQEIIDNLRNNTFYDWISNEGHRLSREELIRIIKEYEYCRDDLRGIDVADSLEEFWTGD